MVDLVGFERTHQRLFEIRFHRELKSKSKRNFLSEALNLINSVYNGLSLEFRNLIFPSINYVIFDDVIDYFPIFIFKPLTT